MSHLGLDRGTWVQILLFVLYSHFKACCDLCPSERFFVFLFWTYIGWARPGQAWPRLGRPSHAWPDDVYTYIHIYIYIQEDIYAYVYMCIYIYIYSCIYTYINNTSRIQKGITQLSDICKNTYAIAPYHKTPRHLSIYTCVYTYVHIYALS